MKIHEIGPFTTENGVIINTMCGIASSHNKIEHPAILIDDDEEMPIMLKMGNADFVQKSFNTMASRSIAYGAHELIKNLHVIILNTPSLSIDDIVTIFNAAINCTGHPILHALCHMTTDIAPVKEHIAMLQRVGY